MASSLDITKLLPTQYRDKTIDSLIKNLFNRFLSKPDTVPLYGNVGDLLNLKSGEVQIIESDLERQINQITPFIYSKHASEDILYSWYDLLQKLSTIGVDYYGLQQWFNTKSYNFVPPIDIDKFCNYQDYFWIGNLILKYPNIDYSKINIPSIAPSSSNLSRTYTQAFNSWGNSIIQPEYYVIARGKMDSNKHPIAPISTINIGTWSDWSYSNLWVHRDDLDEFIHLNSSFFSANDTIQATRPIIEYPNNLGLNTFQLNGIPSDSGVSIIPSKVFKNQLPLFDLYFYDGSHSGITSSIFYYKEDQTQVIDSVIGRRIVIDSSGNFIFSHSLVNQNDQSLYFYKLYNSDGVTNSFKTIWRQPDPNNMESIQYSKFNLTGTIIDQDKFNNFMNYFWIGTDIISNPTYNNTGIPEYYVISTRGSSDWSVYNYWVHVSKLPRSDISKYVQATKPIIEFNRALENQLIIKKTSFNEIPRFNMYQSNGSIVGQYNTLDPNNNDAYLTGRLFARVSDLESNIQKTILSNNDILLNNSFQYNGETYIQGLYSGAYYDKDSSGVTYGYKANVSDYSGIGNGSFSITSISTTSYPEILTFTYNKLGSFDVSGSVTGTQTIVNINTTHGIDGLVLIIYNGLIQFEIGDKFTIEISSFVFDVRNLYVIINGIKRTLSNANEIINDNRFTSTISSDPSNRDGVWLPPPQLEWNVSNLTESDIREGDLYYHLTSIINAQPGLLGSGTGNNNWRNLTQDVGLGGIIKQFDGNTALLISMLIQDGISMNSLIDFARTSYESLSTSITQFVQNVIPDMIVNGKVDLPEITSPGDFIIGTTYTILSIGTTDFTLIGASSNTIGITFIASWPQYTIDPSTGSGTAICDSIDSNIINSFKQYFSNKNSIVLNSPSVVDDIVSSPFYDTTSSLFNLIVTLPYIGLGTLVKPEKILDLDLITSDFPAGMPMLLHHDGHETQLLNQLSVIDYAKKIVQKSYLRSPGQETPGIISGFDWPDQPYAGQFWFKTSTGELYIFNTICDDVIAVNSIGNKINSSDLMISNLIVGFPMYSIISGVDLSGSKYGSYAFNRSTNDIFQTNGKGEWAYIGNSIIESSLPWKKVHLDLIINNLELAIEEELYNKCPTLKQRLNMSSFQSSFQFQQKKLDSSYQSQYNYLMTSEFQFFGVKHNVTDIYSSPTIYTFWTKTLDFLYSQQKTYFKIDPLTYIRETWGTLHKQIGEYEITPDIGRKESQSDFVIHGSDLKDLAQDSWISASMISITSGLFVPGQIYVISSIGTTDFTLIGSTSNSIGQFFVATGVGTGTGSASVEPPNWTYTYTFKCVSRIDGIFELSVDDLDAANDLTIIFADKIIPGLSYIISSLGETNFTLIGASSNTIGVTFIATGFDNSIYPGTVTGPITAPITLSHAPTLDHPIYLTLNTISTNTNIINSLTYKDKYVDIILTPSRRDFFWGDTFSVTIDAYGNISTTNSPQLYYKSEGFNQIQVQYGRIYGSDPKISINSTLLNNWSVKLGYRFSGFINTDNLTVESFNTPIANSAYNIFIKENLFYNSSWIDALKVQLVQRGSTSFIGDVNVPAIGPGGTPGEDWIYRVDNYNKNRTTISWYDVNLSGEQSKFIALDGSVTNFNWTRYKDLTNIQTQNVPFLITGIQNLVNFMEGYSDKMTSDGWSFSDPSDQLYSDNSTGKTGYQPLIEQFIIQQFSGITAGSTFVFNPFYNKVWYRTPRGMISNLYNTLGFETETTCSILNEHGKQISNGDIRVFRQNDISSISFDSPVYTLHLLTSEFEHVILFENYSTNTVLLYDPFLGQRTTWMFFDGQKQAKFTGKLDFDGHFILDNSMKQNIENSVEQLINVYNTSSFSDVDSNTRNMARSLLGYNKKSYFADRNSTDATQFRFWQGMISNKGTNFSIDSFINSPLYQSSSVDEYWAYKIAEYGDSRLITKTELKVQPDDCIGEYTYYVFLEADDISSATTSNLNTNIDISNYYDEVLYDYGGYSHSTSSIIYNQGNTSISYGDDTRWYSYSDINQLTYLESVNICKMKLPPISNISVGDCFVINDSNGNPIIADAFEIINENATLADNLIFYEQGEYIIGSNPVHFTYPMFERINQSTIKILDLGGTITKAGKFIIGVQYQIQNIGSTVWSYIGVIGTPQIGSNFIAINSGEQPAITIVYGQTYTIKSLGTTDFTLVGAVSNSVGLTFISTNTCTGTGTVFGSGFANTIPLTGTLTVLAYGPASKEYSPNLLYDYIDNVLVKNDIIWWDPARGIHHPQAAASITYDTKMDPAIYTNSISQYKNISTESLKAWGNNQVGKVWLNTNNLWWQPYSDDREFPDIQDRIPRWGALSDASSIEVYEWIKSSKSPVDASIGHSLNGEPAISNYVQRNRTWWQRPIAWKYSSNPILIAPKFIVNQPQRIQILSNIPADGTGFAVLKGDNSNLSFDDLNILQGSKITGVNYLNPSKIDLYIANIFGTAIVTSSSSTTVIGSSNGYSDGPILTSLNFNNFGVVIDENTLTFNKSYLGQYVLSTITENMTLNSPIQGSSLYINGIYSNVTLIGGLGTGATAQITVSGNIITIIKIIDSGINYKQGDSLTANIPTSTLTGSNFSVTVATVDTYLIMMHLMSGKSQQVIISDENLVIGEQLSYNFDQLGLTLNAQSLQKSTILGSIIAADLSSAEIYLRSSVEVSIPIDFDNNGLIVNEFFSNNDISATMGWISWNDPSINPNIDVAPPLNQYSPLSGAWIQVGNHLHDVSKDILMRIADPWTWFDGLDYTPYKSSWTQWKNMVSIVSEYRYKLKILDTYQSFSNILSQPFHGIDQQSLLNRTNVFINERSISNSQWTVTRIGFINVIYIKESLLKTGDVVRVIVKNYIPSTVELNFDPSISDPNQMILTQYKLDYPYVMETLRDKNNNLTIVNYYYWVKNKTTPGNPNQLSTKMITNLLIAHDSIYAVPQIMKFYNQFDGRPNRYSTLCIKSLNSVVSAVDRYKLRLNKNPTLRDRDENLSLKPVFTEWMLLRSGQLNLIPSDLWTILTNTLTGSTMSNQSLPFTPLAIYDQKNNTSVGIGLNDGQVMTSSTRSINTVKYIILNTKVNKYENGILLTDYIYYTPSPVSQMYAPSDSFDISKLDLYLSNTNNIRQFMSDIWRFAKTSQINEIFFAVLEDMVTDNLEIDSFFKTSFISLNDVRINVGI